MIEASILIGSGIVAGNLLFVGYRLEEALTKLRQTLAFRLTEVTDALKEGRVQIVMCRVDGDVTDSDIHTQVPLEIQGNVDVVALGVEGSGNVIKGNTFTNQEYEGYEGEEENEP